MAVLSSFVVDGRSVTREVDKDGKIIKVQHEPADSSAKKV